MTRDLYREDIFVSVCFADVPSYEAGVSELRKLSQRLAARFRYCEILLAVAADVSQDYEALLGEAVNARFLMMRPGTPFYRRRSVIAAEAIGDIVVLASVDELRALDVIKMIERAADKGSIIVGRRGKAGLMNTALRALGRSAGFRVDTRIMLSAAYPRPLLAKLLAHPDRQLALRFPPADAWLPVIWERGWEGRGPSRSFREMGRRLAIIQKLLISSAPRVLTLVSLLSLVVAIAAFAFAAYAVVVWVAIAKIQPGWFTTSLVLSLTAAFLGVAIFGLTIGLQKVIESLPGDVVDDIIDERGSIDMFKHAMNDLNVEIAADHLVVAPSLAKQREVK